MRLDQIFPVSIEVQLLGGVGTHPRPTSNLCTPGTHVVVDGKLITTHCTNSSSPTLDGDQWVTVEVEVPGNRVIRRLINGLPAFEYRQPQYDESDPDARKRMAGSEKLLDQGTNSLQAESHPVEFRKIEHCPLPAELSASDQRLRIFTLRCPGGALSPCFSGRPNPGVPPKLVECSIAIILCEFRRKTLTWGLMLVNLDRLGCIDKRQDDDCRDYIANPFRVFPPRFFSLFLGSRHDEKMFHSCVGGEPACRPGQCCPSCARNAQSSHVACHGPLRHAGNQ